MSEILQHIEADSPDGVHLFADVWGATNETARTPTGRSLVIVHGYGEHSGRYRHFAKNLGDVFDHFFAIDLRGHGRSSGTRGDAPGMEFFLSDIRQLLDKISSRIPREQKLMLYAHSFGGLVALNALLKEKNWPFTKAVISAPLLGLALKIPGWKRMLGDVLVKVLPTFQIANEVNPSHLSHDPVVVEGYVKDRLVHRMMTPRMFHALKNSMLWVTKQTGPLPCPTLFLVPKDDLIVDPHATLSFFRALKDRNKQIIEYPGFFHEPHNEIQKEKVFEDARKWFSQ